MSAEFGGNNKMGKSVAYRQGQVFPTPVREGVFDRNKKSDGIAYADAKTKARKFDLDKLSQAYNPNRLVHVSAADAIINPYVTIRHEEAMPKKDPGYTEFAQQDLVTRDKKRRVITDYYGRPIIKVDQEGGIFDQQLNQGAHARTATLEKSAKTLRSRTNPRIGAFTTTGDVKNLSNKFQDLQTALQTVNKGSVRDINDIDSSLSTRGLMQRKLYLMKMMLKNEKHCNNVMKQKIGDMGKELHENNYTIRKLSTKIPHESNVLRM